MSIYKPTNIAGAATTTVVSGSGSLHSIIVNTPVANGTITIYDNTAGSGTKIGTITLPASLLSSGPVSVIYDATFAVGLTIVTVGASLDLTVNASKGVVL